MSTQDLSQHTPSLFDAAPPLEAVNKTADEEKGTGDPSKDFVRWCFSLGSDFRNSPDITNLRSWAKKAKLKLKPADEDRLLEESRQLFGKRLELHLKNSRPISESNAV